jgi:hypothetical protein
MEKKLNIAIALLAGLLFCTFFMVISANVMVTPDAVGFGIGGKQYVWLGQNADGVYVGDIKFGEGLPANSGTDIGDVTLNNPDDITVTLDSEVISADVTGQGDVPITLDGEEVDMSDDLARLLGKITNYDILANGTITDTVGTVEMAGAGLSTVGIGVSGSWAGTLVAETTAGDGVWDPVPLVDNTLGSAALSTTSNGNYLLGVAGSLTVRVRATAWTSGTATIYAEGTSAPAGVFLSRSIPTGLNSIGTVGLNAGTNSIGKVDSELAAAAALADAVANPTVPKVGAAELLYNGSAWDRERGSVEATVLTSAARTATTNSSDQTNYNHNALLLFIDVSAINATPSVTPQLDFKDPVSSEYEPIWIANAALTAAGEYVYMFALGGSGSAGEYDEAVNILIPRTWRVTMTHADADAITYTVGSVLLTN